MPALCDTQTLDRIASLAMRGGTSASIAAAVGMTPDAVRKLCSRYGFKLRRIPANKLEVNDPTIVDRVREAIHAGMSTMDICATLRISTCALHRIRTHYDIKSPRAFRAIEKRDLVERMARGMSTVAIAAELGTTRDRVAKAQRRFGLYYTDEQRRQIRTSAGKANPNQSGPYRGPVTLSAHEEVSIHYSDSAAERRAAAASDELLARHLGAGVHWLPDERVPVVAAELAERRNARLAA